MSDRLPLSPISPDSMREARRVTDMGRAQLARLNAASSAEQARNRSTQALFQALGAAGRQIQRVALSIADRDGFAMRTQAESQLSVETTQWLANAAAADTPSANMLGDFLAFYERRQADLGNGITYRPQWDAYNRDTEQRKMSLAQRVVDLAGEKALASSRRAFYAAQGRYIESGNVEAINDLWKDATEAGVMSADDLRLGGPRDRARNAAAMRGLERVAQAIYEAEGMEPAEAYVRDVGEHPDEWGGLSDSDRDAVLASITAQEKVDQDALERHYQADKGAFLQETIFPILGGQEPAPSFLDLQSMVNTTFSYRTDWQNAEDTMYFARLVGAGGRSTAMPEVDQQRSREMEMAFRSAIRTATPEQQPALRQAMGDAYVRGEISQSVASNLATSMDAALKAQLEPGLRVIRDFFQTVRINKLAVEHDWEIRGGDLYDGKDRVDLGPGQGDAIMVVEDGVLKQRYLSTMQADWEAEFTARYQQMLQAGDVADVGEAAGRFMYSRATGMLEGEQEHEDPLRQAEAQIAAEKKEVPRTLLGRLLSGEETRTLDEYPAVEGWQAGIDFLGPTESFGQPLRVSSEPLSDNFTGAPAVRAIARQALGFPGLVESPDYQRAQAIREEAIRQGQYAIAARAAAMQLPPDAAALEGLRRDGYV